MIFIIGCIFFGVFLAIVFAPVIIAVDRKKLKDADKKIEEFEKRVFDSPEEKEKAKKLFQRELIEIKAKIISKQAKEQIGDRINIL
jgi:uncharacterized membrane protein (DUF106 family)